MKKQRTKFVLADASIDEVNKQLKTNLFVIVVILFILGTNIMHFLKDNSVFYAILVALMVVLLFLMIKSRNILKLRKQQLTQ